MILPSDFQELIVASERLATSVAGRLFQADITSARNRRKKQYNQLISDASVSFHPLYLESVEAAHALAIHFTPGTSAQHLIEKIRPYEPPELRDYRVEIYEPVTQSYASKIVNLQRSNLFSSMQFYLEESDSTPLEEEDSLLTYLTKGIPGVTNIETYFKDAVLAQAQRDVNAFYAVMPYLSDDEHLEVYGNEAGATFRQPVPVFIPSTHALYYGQNFLLARSDDVVLVDGKECSILYLFTDNFILLLIPSSFKNNVLEYTAEIYTEHDLSYKETVRQIGGTIAKNANAVLTRHASVLYESPLAPSVSFFNTALQELSDLRAAIITHLHPQRYEAAMTCDDCQGHGAYPDGATCRTCGGTGMIPSSTTMHAITVEPNEAGDISPPAGYVSFNTDIITKAFEWYRHNIEEAFSALSMDFLFRKSGNAGDTARSKEIDREELHAHFRKVADLIFPIFQWMVDGINLMRYSVNLGERVQENRVIVHYPFSFDTTQPNEALERFDLTRKAGADIAYLVELAKEMYGKTLGTQSDAYKRSVLALALDPAPLAQSDDLMATQALGGAYTDAQLQLKARIPFLIGEAERQRADFLSLPFDQQRDFIMSLFNQMEKADAFVPDPIAPGDPGINEDPDNIED